MASLKSLEVIIAANNQIAVLHRALRTAHRGICAARRVVVHAAYNARSVASCTVHLARCTAQRAVRTLQSLEPLASLEKLMSITVDSNKLDSLDELDLKRKPHLAFFSARNNVITELPHEIGECGLLTNLYLKQNRIETVPSEVRLRKKAQGTCLQCSAARLRQVRLLKKLKELELEDNPIADPKIRKMMTKGFSNFLKELFPYLEKNVKAAKGKGKKGKGKADSDDEEEDELEEASSGLVILGLDDDDDEPEAPAAATSKKGEPKKAEPKAPAEAPAKKLSKKDQQKLERKQKEEEMMAKLKKANQAE
jgi:hypothetical protein